MQTREIIQIQSLHDRNHPSAPPRLPLHNDRRYHSYPSYWAGRRTGIPNGRALAWQWAGPPGRNLPKAASAVAVAGRPDAQVGPLSSHFDSGSESPASRPAGPSEAHRRRPAAWTQSGLTRPRRHRDAGTRDQI
eukprot:756688-Hanusia_phi.AAC.2